MYLIGQFRPIKYTPARFLSGALEIVLQKHRDLHFEIFIYQVTLVIKEEVYLVQNGDNIVHLVSNNDVSYEVHNRIEVFLENLQLLIAHLDRDLW